MTRAYSVGPKGPFRPRIGKQVNFLGIASISVLRSTDSLPASKFRILDSFLYVALYLVGQFVPHHMTVFVRSEVIMPPEHLPQMGGIGKSGKSGDRRQLEG